MSTEHHIVDPVTEFDRPAAVAALAEVGIANSEAVLAGSSFPVPVRDMLRLLSEAGAR